MSENKFIVEDATDVICIGGFGNDLGNKGLLKYSEKEIAKMIIENNNTNDNVRLVNSLLKTIRNQDNIIKEVRELVENGTDFRCITFRKADEDTWKLIFASHIKEDFLEILDKENI